MSTMSVSIHLRLVDQFTRQAQAVRDSLQAIARSATDLQRAFSGSSSIGGNFARLTSQARAVGQEVRALARDFNQLGSAMNRGGAGRNTLAQRQISDLQQVLSLQRQVIANNGRMVAGPAARMSPVGPRFPGGPPAGPAFARTGFNPNASLADRIQNRIVGFGEQSLLGGALELDRARTQLQMLATPRRNPNNPDELLPGVITPQAVAQAEVAATQLSQQFRALNRSHILDTFREIATQFADINDAFAFLPELLRIQEWQVIQGDNIDQARNGMLRLVRAIGLSGRLIGNDGRLKMDEAAGFLDNYLRARMIGGRDVTPDQVFQVMKYLKTTGQTLSQEALLTAFIAMPDIRGSTFGTTLDQLRLQLSGRATQAAQSAMEAGGLGTRGERTQSGPHVFTPVDAVLLNENPFEWFNRHVLGPEGYLRRQGIDPMTASAAEISATLRPLFSRATVESIANMIVHQQAEWRTQVQNALRANLTDEARQTVAGGSAWYQLVAARSSLFDVIASVTDNFKKMLPALETITNKLKQIAAFVDPEIGNPIAGLGLLGSAGLAGLIMMRRLIMARGLWARTGIGAVSGFMLGGIPGALMGAMMLRSMAGPATAAAATAVGATLGRRILGGLGTIMKRIPGYFLLTGVIYAIEQIAENWETVKSRILAVWEDLQRAAPTWLWGQGEGVGALTRGRGLAQINQDIANGLRPTAQSIESWLQTTEMGRYLVQNGWIEGPAAREARLARAGSWERLLADVGPGFAATPQQVAAAQRTAQTTVNVGGISVTVNVTQPTPANPQAIGEAAGNAVQSQVRQLLADPPSP